MGGALERCRFHFLPHLADRSRALVFGDGDGRFLARLLAQNPTLTADAVDTSGAMLDLLRERCRGAASNSESRLHTHTADALSYLAGPSGGGYDLVVTHFFLDCLTQREVDLLADALVPKLAPDAVWVVSDFRIPEGWMRLPALTIVGTLYLAFRIITGLRTNKLPDHATAMKRTGLVRIDCHCYLFGILTTELWTRS